MATTNEKVSKFLTAITQYAEQQKHSILDEVEAYKKKELDKAEAEVLRGAYQLIQKETAEMRGSIRREISGREMDSRRALLAQRREITEKVFDRARDELIAFTKTTDYVTYMEHSAKEIVDTLTKDNTVLYVKGSDMKLRDTLQKALGYACPIEADGTIQIGGIKGVNRDKNLIADNSLDEKLYEQREWFALNSGLSVVN